LRSCPGTVAQAAALITPENESRNSRSALLVLVISRISRWALMSWRAGEEPLAGLVAELLHLGEQVA